MSVKILFLCAHPDDLEFYLGHLLYALGTKNTQMRGKHIISSKFPSQPIEYQIASMTRGEMSDFTKKIQSSKEAAQIRSNELKNALAELGCAEPEYLGFFDGFIPMNATAVERIRRYLEMHNPDIVISPEPVFTWYHHKDHKNTGKLVYKAIQAWHKDCPKRKKPLIYYYTSLFNHYFFPKFHQWNHSIQNALLQHESQQDLLRIGKIPDFLTSFFCGFRIRGFHYGLGLRRQFRANIDPQSLKSKLMHPWTFEKRIFYYILVNLWKIYDKLDYSTNFPYVDGTLQNSVFPPLIPDLE